MHCRTCFYKKLKDEKDETIEISELPDDMIHIITSFLLLVEIVQFQNSCHLFTDICKINTYETLSLWASELSEWDEQSAVV